MKRIVKLTESELVGLIKKIVSEQYTDDCSDIRDIIYNLKKMGFEVVDNSKSDGYYGFRKISKDCSDEDSECNDMIILNYYDPSIEKNKEFAILDLSIRRNGISKFHDEWFYSDCTGGRFDSIKRRILELITINIKGM